MSIQFNFRPLTEIDPHRLVDIEAEIDLSLSHEPEAIIRQLMAVPPEHQTAAWRSALERCIADTPLYDQIDASILLYGVEFVRDCLWRVPRAERNQSWLAAWELVDMRWWEKHGVRLDKDDGVIQTAI